MLLPMSRIDGDAGGAGVVVTAGAVRNIDVAAGIQSDAFGEIQAGVAPTDSGEGRDVPVAPLGVDGDAHGEGVGDVNVSIGVDGRKLRLGKSGRCGGCRGNVAVARDGISRHGVGIIVSEKERLASERGALGSAIGAV